jgi:hypothetical protein
MLALRFVALLALAVWVGGLIALGGIAAPATFDVLALRRIPDDRLLAGAIIGEILRRFHLVEYACGLLVPLSLIARAILGPRPRRFAMRAGLATVMLGAVLYSGLVVSPRIERIQKDAGVAPSRLAENDPRRIEFGRLHGLSFGIQLVPMLGGLLLLIFEMKD